MNSDERLQTALEHREPDRVPFDLGSTKMTGISITAYRNYLSHIGRTDGSGHDPILDRIQQLARLPENFLRELHVDTRGIFPAPLAAIENRFASRLPPDPRYDRMTDEWGIGWQMPVKGGLYYDLYHSPLAEEPDPDTLSGYAWPDGGDPRRLKGMEESIRAFGEQRAGIVLHGFTSGMFEMYQRLRGFENSFMDLIADEKNACRYLDRIVESKIRFWEQALRLSEGRIRVAVEVDDLGTQNSLLVSRELYRKVLFPRHRKLFRAIHGASPRIKVFLHSCGAVRGLIPDLIEAGVDILNPVQISADGMDPLELKREFGKDITFWGGGVDTQRVLPSGTPEEVRENVRRNMEALAPGGGFVFAAVHNIQGDVPPENLEAMLETLEEYGRY